MTLIKRNSKPTNLPQFFDDFFAKDFFNRGFNDYSSASLPSVNIIENNTAFEVEMAAPGMSKKDFQIELHNETLKISAEKKVGNEMKEDIRFVRREYDYQSFERTFQLSKEVVDASKIEAKYKDGILSIVIPKKEEAKALPPRTIQIK